MATLGLTEAERESIERFEQEVIHPSMAALVVLDFWADWCGPCKQFAPVLDKVAADYAAKGVKLAKIDVDKDKLIAAQFQIQSIPTLMIVRDNVAVFAQPGALPEPALEDVIAQARALDMDEVRKSVAQAQAQQGA